MIDKTRAHHGLKNDSMTKPVPPSPSFCSGRMPELDIRYPFIEYARVGVVLDVLIRLR